MCDHYELQSPYAIHLGLHTMYETVSILVGTVLDQGKLSEVLEAVQVVKLHYQVDYTDTIPSL